MKLKLICESKIILNGWLLQYKGTFFFIQKDSTPKILKSKISALRRFIKIKMLKAETHEYYLNRGCFRTIMEVDKIDSPLTDMVVVYGEYLFTKDGNIRPSEDHLLGGGGFVKLVQDTKGLIPRANEHNNKWYQYARTLSGPVYIV